MPLVENAKLVYKPLRKLVKHDLKALKAFINKYLKKGFIKELTSLQGAPMIFTKPKKNSN